MLKDKQVKLLIKYNNNLEISNTITVNIDAFNEYMSYWKTDGWTGFEQILSLTKFANFRLPTAKEAKYLLRTKGVIGETINDK